MSVVWGGKPTDTCADIASQGVGWFAPMVATCFSFSFCFNLSYRAVAADSLDGFFWLG